jgi:hypothetical protein
VQGSYSVEHVGFEFGIAQGVLGAGVRMNVGATG